MKNVLLLVVLSAAVPSPVSAQSRVYTNADLGKKITSTRTPTVEEMQGVVARQFKAPSEQTEPQVYVMPYDPGWPFTYSQRLEPDPWRTPAGFPMYWPWYGTYSWPVYGNFATGPFGVHPAPWKAAKCSDAGSGSSGGAGDARRGCS